MQSTPSISAFPLQWPVGWKRTEHRKKSRYRSTDFVKVRGGVIHEITLLKGRDIVFSSNVPVRRDGLPYASYSEPSDCGVAVYWNTGIQKATKPMVMACDSWLTLLENAHAIELALDALRALERTGASQLLERAFTGFAALPASTTRPWQAVLGLNNHCNPSLEDLEIAFRARARVLHPDAGGSHDAMVELTTARDAGRKEIDPHA